MKPTDKISVVGVMICASIATAIVILIVASCGADAPEDQPDPCVRISRAGGGLYRCETPEVVCYATSHGGIDCQAKDSTIRQ